MNKETIGPPILLRAMIFIFGIPIIPCAAVWWLVQPTTPLFALATALVCILVYFVVMCIVAALIFLFDIKRLI